jgi:hypothetical protein
MHNDFRAGLEYDPLWRFLQYDSPDVTILMDCPTVVIRLAIFEIYRSTTDGATREQTFVRHDGPPWGEDALR